MATESAEPLEFTIGTVVAPVPAGKGEVALNGTTIVPPAPRGRKTLESSPEMTILFG